MTKTIEIIPGGTVRGTIRPPGSKSITNRALICAAMAAGDSQLTGVLDSEDTQVMIAALRQLGVTVAHDSVAATLRLPGCSGQFPVNTADLYVANSGTTARFLTAALAATSGEYRIDGVARMRERPIQDLLDALRQLGASIRTELGNGCPPVLVQGRGMSGGSARVAGNISSQFLSGLLMAAPYAQQPVTLHVQGDLVSRPYVDMTLSVMRSFGVGVECPNAETFHIAPQHYQGQSYSIEPDASAASYFFAAAAITGGQITVEGLSKHSLQGDVAFCDCLEQMGCEVRYDRDQITVIGRPLHGIDVDMNAISDTVQTLGAVAVFADGPTRVRNVAHIRHKETDRIHALAAELRKVGAVVEEADDGLTIHPRPLHGATIATYNDHRMAMSLALVGLKVPGIVINDPDCTGKTYPAFFDDLERVRFRA